MADGDKTTTTYLGKSSAFVTQSVLFYGSQGGLDYCQPGRPRSATATAATLGHFRGRGRLAIQDNPIIFTIIARSNQPPI